MATIAGKLLVPGQRLGWVFRDRRDVYQPYGEPQPEPAPVPTRLLERREGSRTSEAAFRLALSAAVAVLLIGLAWTAGWVHSTFDWNPAGTASTVLAWCLLLPALVAAVSIGQFVIGGQTTYEIWKTKRETSRRHHDENAAWEQRKLAHEQAEAERISVVPEWVAATTRQGARRLDVFGGSLWGWEALLTVHGMGVLAARPLIVLDFSRELVCGELAQMARTAGLTVHTQSLPDQLTGSDLASGMPPRKLADVLIEAMYGDQAETMRAERSLDHRILSKLCEVLSPDLTIARLAAALAAMMGETTGTSALSPDEQDRICDEVFSQEYRSHNHAAISRMEAFLHPVKDLGTSPAPHVSADLRCIAIDDDGGNNPRAELLTDLIVQYLTYQLAQAGGRSDHGHGPDVVVAGADELARRHLERLADVCERRHVPLTLLFRHLREQSLDLVGGGAVAFMRLGNHQEAAAAADFIGRGHKFVLSQLTKTLGGNETHTNTDTKGGSAAKTRGKSVQYEHLGIFPEGSATQRAKTTGRNWAAAKSFAEGTNWANAEARQRVYEYTVEPTTLQHLPDYALLLTETMEAGQEPTLTPVACDPSIATLPRVALQPDEHRQIAHDPTWRPAAQAHDLPAECQHASGAAEQPPPSVKPPPGTYRGSGDTTW